MLRLNNRLAVRTARTYSGVRQQQRGIKNVTIVGGGLMGSGIAQVAAANNFNVTLMDQKQEFVDRGVGIIDKSLSRVFKKKITDQAEAEKAKAEVMSRIATSTDAVEATRSADLVIEAIVENLDAKRQLFSTIDKTAPDSCIFASNTSSLPIADIAESTARLDRFGGVHFFNPVPVMSLVEIIRTNDTSDATFDALLKFGTDVGKHAVKCKDTPGFIVNRLLVPYMFEAIRMAERGDASLDDIDESMKRGAGYPMGPFQLLDYVGLDTTKSIMEGWSAKYPNDPLFKQSPWLNQLVNDGKMGVKSGEGFYKYENGKRVR